METSRTMREEAWRMVKILVKEKVIFLVNTRNHDLPVTITATFFGVNIFTKYSDDFSTVNGDLVRESPQMVKEK